MSETSIQWCRYTFNAWMGCRKVAPECSNCYITETPPFKFRGLTHGPERVRTAPSTWNQPLAWNRKAAKEGVRERVFSLSLGDWLDDENVPIEWLADLLKLIHDTPHLDWLLLSKRTRNWKSRMEHVQARAIDAVDGRPPYGRAHDIAMLWCRGNAPSNVWIGVSAGADQEAALNIPAKIHFLSCEPMLHALDTTHAARFDWIIFGGESGKKARECRKEWVRDAVRFCRENGVVPFVKQLGSNCTDTPFSDSHGGEMDEWPEDLRVREFPTP